MNLQSLTKGMKKKIGILATLTGFLGNTRNVLADVGTINIQQPKDTSGKIIGLPGDTPINTIFQNAITIIFIGAAILVLIMLIVGAFQWILSGGDKEAVGKARGRIINALIGLAILALAFVILTVVGKLVNVDLTGAFTIPSLGDKPR